MSQSARRVAVGGGNPAIPPPDGPKRGTSINNELETAFGIGFALATTFFNMLNADSPSGVLNAAMEGGLDFMGGAVGGPSADLPARWSARRQQDSQGPEGFGEGDCPLCVRRRLRRRPVRDVGCIPNGGKRGGRLCFGGDCGRTAGAILGPAVPIDVGRARMQAQRR